MILPFDSNFKEPYLSELNKTLVGVYWVIIAGLMIALAALPLIYVDVSIKSSGKIRPTQERTEIKSPIAGIIDSIHVSEGQEVLKGALIVTIENIIAGKKTASLLKLPSMKS